MKRHSITHSVRSGTIVSIRGEAFEGLEGRNFAPRDLRWNRVPDRAGSSLGIYVVEFHSARYEFLEADSE